MIFKLSPLEEATCLATLPIALDTRKAKCRSLVYIKKKITRVLFKSNDEEKTWKNDKDECYRTERPKKDDGH